MALHLHAFLHTIVQWWVSTTYSLRVRVGCCTGAATAAALAIAAAAARLARTLCGRICILISTVAFVVRAPVAKCPLLVEDAATLAFLPAKVLVVLHVVRPSHDALARPQLEAKVRWRQIETQMRSYCRRHRRRRRRRRGGRRGHRRHTPRR